MRKIYFLNVTIYDNNKDQQTNYCSDVFLTLKEAIESGKEYLKVGIEEEFYMSEKIFYSYLKGMIEEPTIAELKRMIKSLRLDYSFWIHERDLEYEETFQLPETEEQCNGLEPTTIRYRFNIAGELQEKHLDYSSKSDNRGFSFCEYPRRGFMA